MRIFVARSGKPPVIMLKIDVGLAEKVAKAIREGARSDDELADLYAQLIESLKEF